MSTLRQAGVTRSFLLLLPKRH